MNITEYEAKALLKAQGIPIPPNAATDTPEEAAAAAVNIGLPLVIKAQVPTGGRMKAGGILFAETPEQVAETAKTLLGLTIRGFAVERLLIERKLNISREVFFAVTYDAAARCPVLIASARGGIDIESSADGTIRQEFSILTPPSEYLGREVAARLGCQGQDLLRLAGIINTLVRCFLDWDALLLEVNPIIQDDAGQWSAADVHLELDDDAAFRQGALLSSVPFSAALASRQSEFAQRAAEIDRADHRGVAGRLVPFDGNLGLLIGGGGASLTVMDAVFDAGLKPANYCEIGGNPSVWKIKELTKLILSQPQVDRLAVIMNVVSNTRADLIARGVIKGILELGREPREVVTAFRVPGSWEDEGRALLNYYGIRAMGRETSIDQVVEALKAAISGEPSSSGKGA